MKIELQHVKIVKNYLKLGQEQKTDQKVMKKQAEIDQNYEENKRVKSLKIEKSSSRVGES